MSWFKKLCGRKCKCHEEKKEEPAVMPAVEATPEVEATPAVETEMPIAEEENTQV